MIYVAICNLPCDIRFKPENILILGILPGPNEVGLHMINHYLSPIVDELNELCKGFRITTYERSSGRDIKAALIMTACDIPAS